MGLQDLERLHPIYRTVTDFTKLAELPYQFKEDLGSYETAIEFTAIGYNHPPKSKSWEESKEQGNEIKCPDLLDFENRIIIEFEEEPKAGKKMGKLGKKGHTEESARDSHRDQLYRIAGFRVLKIWESDYKNNTWRIKLFEFLIECWRKDNNNG